MVDGRTRTGKLVNRMKGQLPAAQAPAPNIPIMGMTLPNHSGDHSAGIVNSTPVKDVDIVNKVYVDGNFVPYIGAIANVNLGTKTLTTTKTIYNTLSSVASSGIDDLLIASLAGAVTILANDKIVLESSITGLIETGGDIIPAVNNEDDLGSTAKKFKDLHLSGDATVDGLGTFSDLTITSTTPDYKLTNSSGQPLMLVIEAGNSSGFWSYMTENGDGAGNLQARYWAKGQRNDFVNSEWMRCPIYFTSSRRYQIDTGATGTGTILPLWLSTGANTGQFKLNVDGSSTFGAGDVFVDAGDLIFRNIGTGLLYGEIFVNDNTTITSVSSAGFTQFLHFNTNGHSNNTTNDHTNDHILIREAGIYTIDCCVNVKNDSGAAHDIEVVISKNNNATIFPNLRRHRTLGTGSDIGAIPLCGHVSLDEDDTIEVWITSDSASARNVIAEDVTLMVTMTGGS